MTVVHSIKRDVDGVLTAKVSGKSNFYLHTYTPTFNTAKNQPIRSPRQLSEGEVLMSGDYVRLTAADRIENSLHSPPSAFVLLFVAFRLRLGYQ